MKELMSYRDQINRAKQEVGSWTSEKRSWMQAQGTNEYIERRILDQEPPETEGVKELQKSK